MRDERFPADRRGPGATERLPSGFGIRRSATRDEYLRLFFSDVDSLLGAELAEDRRPVIVVGVERWLSFFTEVTSHADALAGYVTGNQDETPERELAELVMPAFVEYQRQQRADALAKLDDAMSGKRFAGGIDEVWRLAQTGRIDHLFVEEDFRYPAIADDYHVEAAADDDPEAVNAVDLTIARVLRTKGEVTFVAEGKLTEHRRIAAALRW